MDYFEITSQGERIIKPLLEVDMKGEANEQEKRFLKTVSSSLSFDWDKEQGEVNTNQGYTEEEAQYLEEIAALAEKIMQIRTWAGGIEEEYEDLESEEVLGKKEQLTEREEEYLEVKNQLRSEEMNTLIDYFELVVDFLHAQKNKIKRGE